MGGFEYGRGEFGLRAGAFFKAGAEEAASEALFPRRPKLRMVSGKGAIGELNADPCKEYEEDEGTGNESGGYHNKINFPSLRSP